MKLHSTQISEIESETIRFWEDVAEFIGFPRSAGKVYGIYFTTEEPLSADEIAQKTNMSRSGSGQHIKSLVEIGAIRVSQSAQQRKAQYEIQTDLGVLIRRLLNSRLFPRLMELNAQSKSLHASSLEANQETLVARFEKLERWQHKVAPAAAVLKNFL